MRCNLGRKVSVRTKRVVFGSVMTHNVSGPSHLSRADMRSRDSGQRRPTAPTTARSTASTASSHHMRNRNPTIRTIPFDNLINPSHSHPSFQAPSFPHSIVLTAHLARHHEQTSQSLNFHHRAPKSHKPPRAQPALRQTPNGRAMSQSPAYPKPAPKKKRILHEITNARERNPKRRL